MTIFERIKEERKKLGLTQPEMGEIGGVQKKAQLNYEKGERSPDASYLAAIAVAGADVQYILTGIRSTTALAPDERVLLERYRASPQAVKDAALRVVMIGSDTTVSTVQHISGNQGQVAGSHIYSETGAVNGKKKGKTKD